MPRPLGITSLRLLAAIRDGAAYGLDLVTRTGMPSGTIYPTLARLKKSGLVQGRWEDQRVAEREGRPRRRYYSLTPAGAGALADGAAAYKRIATDLSVGPERA